MDEPQGLVESSFVRKAFYEKPPEKGATVEVWNEWLARDKAKAIAAKRAHTKTLAHGEIPDALQAKVVSKVGGVYRQSSMVGFVSDGADSSRIEVAVDATQDQVVLTPWERVGGRGVSTSKKTNNAKRKKAKALRKERKEGKKPKRKARKG